MKKKIVLQQNYLARKALLAVITFFFVCIVVLQATLFTRFYQQMQAEYYYLLNSDGAVNLTVQQIYDASPSYQIREMFWILNSLTIFFSLISIMILTYMQVIIYTNKGNADSNFMLLFWIIPLVFILLFFVNALKPAKTFLTTYAPTDYGLKPISIGELGEINYITSYIAMALAFVNIVFIIMAKKRFGFVSKDKIIATKPHSVEDLRIRIDQLLENQQSNSKLS
ncbi:hypothetical protein BCF59_0165 [Mycoplasmopsis mustelae]|uniref:Uncharacterized protein n=1 Tax=Mycoplasmopsis mustelae TaxID=171289 RepID=A0A4R7UEY9_9BACT|nr:hypothetical protein [Mycoplasmopsis mustelae]TDV24214.1 hypothetical protein BCF59_0165 [Mycoplasmopsis mustelae]